VTFRLTPARSALPTTVHDDAAIASRVSRWLASNDEHGLFERDSALRPRGYARDHRERSSRRTRPHMTAHAARPLVKVALSRYQTVFMRYGRLMASLIAFLSCITAAECQFMRK
jgi:hypothetical protein